MPELAVVKGSQGLESLKGHRDLRIHRRFGRKNGPGPMASSPVHRVVSETEFGSGANDNGDTAEVPLEPKNDNADRELAGRIQQAIGLPQIANQGP